MKDKKIVFVATYPDQKTGRAPSYFADLEKRYTVLHPSFDYESQSGIKIRSTLPPDIPNNPNPWHQMQSRDYWGLKNSHLMVYDIDVNPGEHFIAAALIYKVPVLGVSYVLRGMPAYFSQSVLAIVNPKEIDFTTRVIFNPTLYKYIKEERDQSPRTGYIKKEIKPKKEEHKPNPTAAPGPKPH